VTRQLWAPWRLEYIEHADEQSGCIFCDAAEGEDEERLVVHRGEHAFVLLNKFPYSSGHLMVASFRHVGDFAELSDEEALEVHRLAERGLAALAQV
jgi:ATP adenylyltransferase